MYKKIVPVALVLLASVKADLAIFCQFNADLSKTRAGGIVEYEACDGLCTCAAFELVCL